MRRVIPVLLLVLSVVGVSACGGIDTAKQRNTYADEVNRAQNDFAQSFKNLSRRISSTTTPARGRRTLQGFEDAVDTVVRDLRRIDAPSDLQPLHQRLISEIAGYGEAIRKAKEEFATGSPQRSEAAQTALVNATTEISARINRTIAAINRQLQAKK
jgi:hypothetical protein